MCCCVLFQVDRDVLFPQLVVSSQVEQEVVLQVWTAIEIYQNEVKLSHAAMSI